MAMNINIAGRGFNVTPTVRKAAERHIVRVARHLPRAGDAHVVLTVAGGVSSAEIVFRGKGKTFKVLEEGGDMYQALTLAAETLERSVRKYVDRKIDRRRRNQRGEKRQTEEMEAAASLGAGHEAPPSLRLLRRSCDAKPMTVQEAALELAEAPHPFVVFRDAGTGNFHVLYRHDSRSLCLIELEK
jgi:putative sigma-54 modulation protein